MYKNPDSVYIDGGWQKTSNREAVVNPATEQVIGEAPVASAAQAEAAVAAAREAFDKGPWPKLSQKERQAKMSEFLDAVERREKDIRHLITVEAGAANIVQPVQYNTPLAHCRTAIELSSRPAITPLPVETTPAADGSTILGAGVVVRDPAGVVTAITPYNFPFMLNLGKIVPAMVLGNTVVLKPSPYTPYQALILGEVAEEVGIPKGVLNIITGDLDVGQVITTDKRVDLISFTGSDKVGSAIQAQAAPTLKRVLQELGGKSALIVRPDANLQQAALAGISGFAFHCGQGCALLTRHLVHNSIKAQYIDAVKAALVAFKVGNPADPTTLVGPLIREVARKRTEDYVEIAQSQGATLVAGGKRPEGLDKGYFYEPTLFTDVRNDHRIAQEEVFGPIGVVIGYDTDEEAIAIANDSEFGLSGAIYSADVGKAFEMALQIRTGGVSINGGGGKMSSHAPFGGIKRSGYGREYGIDGLNEFTNQKTIMFRGG